MQDVEYKKIMEKIWVKRTALWMTPEKVNDPKNWMK